MNLPELDMRQHFAQLVRWIELEAAAEVRRLIERRQRRQVDDEERSGETLLEMQIVDTEPCLGGRVMVHFAKPRTQPLPWNRFRPGSPVVVSAMRGGENNERSGVVSMRSLNSIHVVVADWLDGDRFRIDMSPDEVTRGRMLGAISRAGQQTGRSAQLRDILLGSREPRFDRERELQLSPKLNSSQQAAVRFAHSARDLAIIHGPPGTGKTTTVIEVIRQAVLAGQTVLACGPSNTAVDNLLVKLVEIGVRSVRLGHPARVARELQDNTLDAQVERHENMAIARDMVRESESLFRKLDRFSRARPSRGERRDMRDDAKDLKYQARELERQAIEHILDRADVICMTTTGDDDTLGNRRFDLAVVDEACQSTEPGCWIPLLRADRYVLAGDHCQLPPTILSDEAAREGFSVSMMERLVRHYGETITRRLDVQYRMHESIMAFSSRRFYNDELIADLSVRAHTLAELPNFRNDALAQQPAVFIDSAGAGWEEELEPDGESKRNREEARLILKKAAELLDAGLDADQIAVIAPYAAQVRLLRDMCSAFGSATQKLEIDTVDGFQGREKEAVLITLVRSNQEGEIGFLGDARRMNVALTRARRKLIVVGDSATLGTHEFYIDLLNYFEQIGGYHTVWEEDI